MSHLLRRPGTVPALFSRAADAAPAEPHLARPFRLREASGLVILPFVVLTAELPFLHGVATLMRLALPH